jgi:hypothetical protein
LSFKRWIAFILFVLVTTASALIIINYNRTKPVDLKLTPIFVEIHIRELDLASKNLLLDVDIYIAKNVSAPIFVQVRGWLEETEIAVNKTVNYSLGNQTGDYWKGAASLTAEIFGHSDWFPFDEYESFLSFENFPKNETRVNVFSSYKFFWDVEYDVSYEFVNIPVSIFLERNLWWSPIVFLPIVATYAMLGASVWIDASKRIGVRLTLFLTVFAAAFTQLFAIPNDLPFRYFLSLPELLLFSVIICSSIFAVLSIVKTGKAFNREELDLWALSLSLSLISICFTLMYVFTDIAASPQKSFVPIVLFSLFCALLWNWYSKPVRIFQALCISVCFTNLANSLFLVFESAKSSMFLFYIIKFLIIGALVPSIAGLVGSQVLVQNEGQSKTTMIWMPRIFFLILLSFGYLPLLSVLGLLPF